MTFPRYRSYRHSGVPWLGDVPAEWRVERMKALVEIKKRIAGREGPEVLSITQKGIKVRNTDSNDGQLAENYAHYQLVEPGDFAMNQMDLLTGWVDISRQHGVTSPDYRVFSLREPERIEARFLLYVLQHAYVRRIFFAYGQGASHFGRWRLPTDEFENFRVPVPTKEDGLAIADFLDRETAKIDALVDEQQRLISLLKEKQQAVISHAMAKGLNPYVSTRTTGLDWPRDMAAHWEILPLTRVVRQFVDYRGATPTKVDEGVPLITATQIKNGKVTHGLDPVFISEEEYATRMTRGFPSRGDVLLTTEAPLGETAQIEEERVAPGQRIILMKVEPSKITQRYLFFHFRSDFGQNELWKRASGSTASGIRADRLRGSLVLVPPLPEQVQIVEEIERQLAPLDGVETEINLQIALLQERRAALISAAVTGKIDIRRALAKESERVRDAACAEIIRLCAAKQNFGRVKMQKLVYLAETELGIVEIAGDYAREAAGPLDRTLVQAVERRLQQVGIVDVQQDGPGSQVRYAFTGRTNVVKEEAERMLGARCLALRDLLKTMGDLDTLSVEAIATLYAAWNDALIDGEAPDDAEITRRVLEEWHPEKAEKFNAEALSGWLAYMRRNNIVPQGRGPRTHAPRLFP